MSRRTVFLLALVAVLVITMLGLYLFVFFGSLHVDVRMTAVALSLMAAAVSIGFAITTITTIRNHPSTVTFSLIGYPGSGKTVYLTTLLNELNVKSFQNFKFLPYGTETIEQVAKDISTLNSGHWLPKTAPNQVFYYRGIVSIGTNLSRRKFKIEIGDYAGEHINEFDPSTDNWLHRTDYFKYAMQSDCIFLCIGGDSIDNTNTDQVRILENHFIAALKVLFQDKGLDVNKKINIPIALLFLKSDIYTTKTWPKLINNVPKLVAFCNTHCSKFACFQTSSIGYILEDGSPPKEPKPVNVVEPLMWALKQTR